MALLVMHLAPVAKVMGRPLLQSRDHTNTHMRARVMAYRIHPDKVYIAVFAFFLAGASLQYALKSICDAYVAEHTHYIPELVVESTAVQKVQG